MQRDPERSRLKPAASLDKLTTWLVPEWQTEWQVKTPDFLRISATAMGAHLQSSCPANAALGVRPGTVFLNGEKYKPVRRSPFETFPLGLVREAFLQVLQARPDLGDEPTCNELAAQAVHSCVERVSSKTEVPREMRTWVVQGVQNLLRAVGAAWTSADYMSFSFEQIDELVALDQASGAGVTGVEWTIWGGVFSTPDGAVRLLQSLCLSGAAKKTLPLPRLATAARVLADGLVAHRPTTWGAPYVANPQQLGEAKRIIVELIGVNDGSRAVLFDDSADAARDLFQLEARPRAELIAVGGVPRPVRKCGSCQASGVCHEPPRRPGLLGIEGMAAWPRILTPSALTTYRTCAHLSYLKDVLGLSAAQVEPSPAQRRGQLVHAWLAKATTRSTQGGVSALPQNGLDEIATELAWAEHDYQDVRPWLEAHMAATAQVAPTEQVSRVDGTAQPMLTDTSDAPTLAETEVVVKDTDADILVVTRPDLLYAKEGQINWRETKTLASPAVNHPDDFFEIYPQIPLAICVLADGGLSDEIARALGFSDGSAKAGEPDAGQLSVGQAGVVELELLWPGGSRVLSWAASDESVVAKARACLAQLTDRWVFDRTWQPPKNPPCRWCPMAHVCELANPTDAAEPGLPDFDPTTGEILSASSSDDSPSSVARALGIIATFSETDRDEEVAF